jgi:phosphate transport system substrate-binding protein
MRMPLILSRTAWTFRALAMVASLTAGAAAFAQDLRIHGSNTVGESLAPRMLQAWSRAVGAGEPALSRPAEGEMQLQVGQVAVELHAHGSNTGMRDLLAGRTDIAMSSRAAFADEIAAARAMGLGNLDAADQEFVIALDGLAIIVHPDNPVRQLDLADVRRLFTGEIRDWSQVGGNRGPVRLYARDDKSGTFESFRMLVLGSETLSPRSQRHESTARLAALVADDRAAIGFVGLGGVGPARALAIADTGTEPMPPLVANVAVEDYLLTRRLYLYLRADASALARRFASFAVSDAAQPAVEASGFVAQTIRPLSTPTPAAAPADYRSMTAGAGRLSVNFRFSTGSTVLDSRATRDLDRLVGYLEPFATNPDYRVMLFGFADATEAMPLMAILLANDRVDYIASKLVARGVPVSRARGFGGQLPVAANATAWGRNKNRRVEVWVDLGGRTQAAGATAAH